MLYICRWRNTESVIVILFNISAYTEEGEEVKTKNMTSVWKWEMNYVFNTKNTTLFLC